MSELTVIIPTYNYAEYLPDAITSALNLNVKSNVIVVDDGSTDNTRDVVKCFLKSNPLVTYIWKENEGPAKARNRGLQENLSEFVVFLDADDSLLSDGVSSLMTEMMIRSDVDCFLTGHMSEDESVRRYHSPGVISASPEVNFRNYLIAKKLKMSNGSVFFRAESIKGYAFPDLRNSEDVPFFAKVLANLSVASIDLPTAVIKKHHDSLRHNLDYAKAVSNKVVTEIFDGSRMPQWCEKYRNRYTARRNLSLFRTFFVAGKGGEAIPYYFEALRVSPSEALRFKYLKRVLKITFYKIFGFGERRQ